MEKIGLAAATATATAEAWARAMAAEMRTRAAGLCRVRGSEEAEEIYKCWPLMGMGMGAGTGAGAGAEARRYNRSRRTAILATSAGKTSFANLPLPPRHGNPSTN